MPFYLLEFIYAEWGSLECATLGINILCSTIGLMRDKILFIIPILRSHSALISHTHQGGWAGVIPSTVWDMMQPYCNSSAAITHIAAEM